MLIFLIRHSVDVDFLIRYSVDVLKKWDTIFKNYPNNMREFNDSRTFRSGSIFYGFTPRLSQPLPSRRELNNSTCRYLLA